MIRTGRGGVVLWQEGLVHVPRCRGLAVEAGVRPGAGVRAAQHVLQKLQLPANTTAAVRRMGVGVVLQQVGVTVGCSPAAPR